MNFMDSVRTNGLLPAIKAAVVGPYVDQEFGLTQESLLKRFELYPYSPDELIKKQRFEIFDKMLTDDMIAQCVNAKKIMRLSSGYEWVPASTDPADVAVKDFIASMLETVNGSWWETMYQMMSPMEMGWYLGEIVWTEIKTGPWAGKIGIKALKSKNPKYFNIVVDDFDNIIKVVGISVPIYGTELPLEKFVVSSFQKRYENVFGTSQLRSLYQWWWIKQVMIRAMGVYMEKFGIPIPIGKYGPKMTDKAQKAFMSALTHLRFEHAITMPNDAAIDFKEATGKGPEGFLAIINHADTKIKETILGQTLTSGMGHSNSAASGGEKGGGGGSRALGQVHEDVLMMQLEYLGRWMTEGPIAVLIKKLVDLNFSGVEKYPTLRWKDIEDQNLASSVQTYLQAVTAGVIVPAPGDAEHIREVLKFPVDAAQEKNERAKSPNSVKPIKVLPAPLADPRTFPTAGYHAGAFNIGSYVPQNLSGSNGFRSGAAPFAEVFTGVSRRAYSKYEGHTDFAEILSVLENDGVKAMGPKVAQALKASVDKLLAKVQREDIIGRKATRAVRTLTLGGKGELNSIFRDGLKGMAKSGMRDARGELRRKVRILKHAELPIERMAPDEVLSYLENRALKATDDLDAAAEAAIQNELFNAIKMNKSFKDVVASIDIALDDFFDEVSGDGETMAGSRIETAVRTLTSEAYNEGRRSMFMDPDVRGVIAALQYSAILDDRVRPNHAAMDESVYPLESPVWDEWTPPNGFNCRCILVPITIFEEYEASDAPKVHPDEGFK